MRAHHPGCRDSCAVRGKRSAEPKKPLQFSLRFALVVLTGVAVFCAAAKTAGDLFWPIVTVGLLISSSLAAVVAQGSLLVLLIGSVWRKSAWRGDMDKRAKLLRSIYLVLAWAIAWCVVPWMLVGIVAVFA